LQHDMDTHAARWRAFGWQALVVDGHNIPALLQAYERAAATPDRPTVVLARTLKGKGIPIAEDRLGWHGKALKKGEETDAAVRAPEKHPNGAGARWTPNNPAGSGDGRGRTAPAAAPAPPYSPGQSVATREAFGAALAALGESNPLIVALDGDVKN